MLLGQSLRLLISTQAKPNVRPNLSMRQQEITDLVILKIMKK